MERQHKKSGVKKHQKTDDSILLETYFFILTVMRDLHLAKNEIQKITRFDPLTELANRNQFEEDLLREMARVKRYNRKLALIYVDIDFFKKVNDNYGHAVGDLLLKEVCIRLHHVVRQEDYIARIGGDEFAVILTEVESPHDAGIVAHRIVEVMQEPFTINGHSMVVGASAGIAVYPDAGTDASTLNKHADIALFSAKSHGRSNYQFFTKDLQKQHSNRLELEAELHFALERKEFFLVYQPRIDLQTEKMVGMEALLRWRHPQRGIISPNDFIPIAEETGLIVPIGYWVLVTACSQLSEWRKHYKKFTVMLSINVSPRQFQHKDFIKTIMKLIEEKNLPPNLLELEVTETAVTSYLGKIENTLFQLRELGVSFSIDDFGTGYSSFSRLKELPIHAIKIDKSFVNDIDVRLSDNLIVKSTLDLAKDMGLKAVAEGVETEAQLRFLIKNHCPEAQGYYYSKPLTVEEMDVFIKKHVDASVKS